jgi:hypothetical protein
VANWRFLGLIGRCRILRDDVAVRDAEQRLQAQAQGLPVVMPALLVAHLLVLRFQFVDSLPELADLREMQLVDGRGPLALGLLPPAGGGLAQPCNLLIQPPDFPVHGLDAVHVGQRRFDRGGACADRNVAARGRGRSFDESKHKIPRIHIPPEWPRFVGIDFGGVNTAAIFFAEERIGMKATGRLIAYREYKTGDRSAAEHCYHLMRGDKLNPPEPRIPLCAGGSKSEDQWRREFAAGGTVMVGGKPVRVPGLPIHGPAQPDVEVGINSVFKQFCLNKLLVFDDLHGFLDELQSYSRELDETGEPTEKIENPHAQHWCDALRYIVSYLNPDKPKGQMKGSPVVRQGLRNL